MLKQILYGMALVGLPLSLMTMTASANYPHCVWTNTTAKNNATAPCDVTFTVVPSFASLCVLGFEFGIYTIKNNTPVTVKINYIRLQNNDGGPASTATLVTAPTNPCGSSLAAGASCNIQVNLQPIAFGTFNRVLQVGINTRQVELDAPAITSAVNCAAGGFPTGPTFGFGNTTITCTILGNTTVTNVPTVGTAVNGDVCTCTGTSITGFPPGILTGVLQPDTGGPTGPACLQKAAEATAFTNRQGLPCDTNLTGQDLGGKTLTPGVYCFNSSAQLTGAVTLNAQGNPNAEFTIQIASTLTTASASNVFLINGAQRDHVFWIVGSSATLGTGTHFQGNVLAAASITLNTNANLQGRAGVGTAAITMDSNVVNPDPTLPFKK